jgi:hypothetical protein
MTGGAKEKKERNLTFLQGRQLATEKKKLIPKIWYLERGRDISFHIWISLSPLDSL